MRTQLSQYCHQFDDTVRPVLAPFGAAIAAIDAAASGTPARGLRQNLEDLRHQLQVLADKVKGQQAFVLIFGPLKSGKSTLMNAVAGTWVSEVSSLPAYPCLVFTSPGPRREYLVTRYDGSTQVFTDAAQLHRHIQDAHGQLADGIRTAESDGKVFDPVEHFPQALRRVDVLVPDSTLQDTGAVLVDTPGLYTRMRFGYDRMTRDFRNAAACAVFVVKSDTLFLEQVFAEFHQLLDLFSRIFLVINVDSMKRDVAPDGKLVPSLEQSRPELILEAFEQLAMSAPLKRAAAEGKVRMYPVDLLHAASSVLQKQPEAQQPPGFVRFQKELQEYLASTDYLNAFLQDSLQRGSALLHQTAELLHSDEVDRLRQRVRDTESRLRHVQEQQQLLQQALSQPWQSAFARWQETLKSEAERSARDEGQKMLRALGASIDTWFLSSHSLDWLLSDQWQPLLSGYRNDVQAAVQRVFEQSLGQPSAGLELGSELQHLLHYFDADVQDLRQLAQQQLGKLQWQGPQRVPVDVDAIPVKKGVLDFVAFRKLDSVRQRLFGSKDKPNVKIQARDKASRLGEAGRLFLHQQVTAFRADLMPATVRSLLQHYGERLQAATIEALQRALQQKAPALQQQEQTLTRDLAGLRALLEPFEQLLQQAEQVPPKLHALATQFGAQLLAENDPMRKDPVLKPEPRRAPTQAEQRRQARERR